MRVHSADTGAAPAARPWARLHAALMPDYNRQATVYWWAMALLGAATLAVSVHGAMQLSAGALLQVAAGIGVAMLAGLFPVRVPHSKNSFAAGEIFIFLLLLLHGPAAAALAAASEGFVGALRTSKRWTSRIITPAMACVAMYATGSLLHAGTDVSRTMGLDGAAIAVIVEMTVCALLYFVLNTLLIAAVPYLKRREWPSLRELFGNFGWIGITYAGTASVACLLYLTSRASGLGVLMAAVPIIATLLSTLHFYFRHQAASEAVRRGRLEAIEREAELAARHVIELQASERQFHSAFSHASIGMALVSFDGRVLQANTALHALLGLRPGATVEQRQFSDCIDLPDIGSVDTELRRLAAREVESFALEVRLRHRDDAETWAALHGSVFSAGADDEPCLILQAQDITARRIAEAGLHRLAFNDSLTGLPNRRRFHELLSQALERCRADPQHHFGLMFLDFDRFKLINDSLGHAVGDEFLIMVSRRIRDHVRPGDVVARLGGDEFAILADDIGRERSAVLLAERLMEALSQPLQIMGHDIITSASIGITFSSTGYATPADMLRDADTAMYKAKASGKARYALFDSGLHREVSERLRLEGDLRRALASGALSIAYQPLFDLAAGRVTGFEALARWQHPELGAIGPDVFIPIAEDAGLIMPLTDFVLRSACAQLRRWQMRDRRFEGLNVHVNISGVDVSQHGLVARVTRALVEARLDPQHLTLELTENILMERLEAAKPTLLELRRLGVGLSVDDFGTGYSSLRHLSTLPVSSLKIDRAFVADLRHGGPDAAVLRAIVALGNSLGKTVIAEGIETAEQMEQIVQMGCSSGQGFHLSRPLELERVDRLLEGMAAAPIGSAAGLSVAPADLGAWPAPPGLALHVH